MKHADWLSALAALLLSASAAAHTLDLNRVLDLNIPAQPLPAALIELSKQTQLQIMSQGNITRQTAPAVTGRYTIAQALTQLLAGTDLEFSTTGDNTVAVVPAGARSTAADTKTTDNLAGTTNAAALRLAQTEGQSQIGGSAKEPSASLDSGVQEIVVTAQKREERLQDVPISISVLGGDQLDSSRVQGISEALSRVPGVSMSENQQGGGTQLTVRGVTTRPVLSGASPIGYYVGAVPFGFSGHAVAPDANAYDLDRVEVLKGPQGTLYGAGGMGGVVRVLTHDADLDGFEFKARTSLSSTEGGDESWRGDMAVNIPLVEDKIAVRAVAGYNNVGGWVESPSRENINDGQLANYRVQLRAQPTDRLRIDLYSWVSRMDFDALALSNDDSQFDSDFLQPTSQDFEAYGAHVTYEFPSFSISSATGYMNYSLRTDQDISFVAGYQTDLSLVTNLDSRVLSEEVVLNSTSDGSFWEWSAGLFYRDEESFIVQPLTIEGVTNVPGVITNTSTQYAIFGELHRWLVRDQLKLTAGLRYFNDDTENSGRLTDGRPLQGDWPGNPVSASYHKLTPRVVLTWLPDDDLTMYATYGQGFRSGLLSPSFITHPPAEPDTLTNYEIGTKGDLFGGRVSFDIALYFTDWQDIQQNILSTCDLVGAPGVTFTCFVVDNAGSASGPGVDLALSFRPVDRLSLGVGLGWNDLTYDDDVIDAVGFKQYVGGTRIGDSPEYTANVFADYVVPLGGSGLKGRFSGSANYTSGRIFGLQTSNSLLIGNASVSIESPDHWTATLFADNITNEQDAVFVSFLPEWSPRNRPRTFGLQLQYQY